MGGPGSGRPKGGGKNQGGRPPSLTDDVREQIVKLVEAGNYIETAVLCVGVSRSSYKNWMRWGAKQETGIYRQFFNAVRKAEALAEARAIVRVRQAGQKWWQAEAWYLERKYPDRWGRYDRGAADKQPETISETRKAIEHKDVRDLLDQVARRIGMAGDAGGHGSETK